MLKVKRVYQARQDDDGTRILVDRLWPRGLSLAKADIDQWLKELAPSVTYADGLLTSQSDGQSSDRGI